MIYVLLLRGKTDEEIDQIDLALSGEDPEKRRGEGPAVYESQQAALAIISGQVP